MSRDNLLEKGKNITKEIYEKMTIIETCDNVVEAIKDLPITFLDENKSLIGLEKVLSEEQIINIRKQIVNTIEGNSKEAENWLEKIAGLIEKPEKEEKPAKRTTRAKKTEKKEEPKEEAAEEVEENAAIPEPEEEKQEKTKRKKKTEQKPEPEEQKKEEKKQELEISEKELAEMYIRDNMSLQQIAAELGTDKKTVFAKIEEYDLKEPSGMSDSERKTWAKRAMERYN